MNSLIRSAPIATFSRMCRRISSSPSENVRAAPCPLRAVIGRVATSSRGPGSRPSAMAARSSMSMKCSSPTTRIVVTPDRRSARRFCTARSSWGAGPCRSWPIWSPSPGMMDAWECASTRPGRSVCAPQSRTSVPSGMEISAWRPTAAMRPPSTSTTPRSIGRRPVPSMTSWALTARRAGFTMPRLPLCPFPLALPRLRDGYSGVCSISMRRVPFRTIRPLIFAARLSVLST